MHIIHHLLIYAYLELAILPNVQPEAGSLVRIGGWILYPVVIRGMDILFHSRSKSVIKSSNFIPRRDSSLFES